MATIDIDVEATHAFLAAVIERIDAEEFEALMSESNEQTSSVWDELERSTLDNRRAMDRMRARLARVQIMGIEDGEEQTALAQLKLQRTLDELARRYEVGDA